MLYLLTLYGNQATWGHQAEEEHNDEMSAFGRFEQEATKAGVLKLQVAMQPASDAVTVLDGQDAPTRGPAAAPDLQTGAVYLLDCETEQDAVHWANMIPLVGDGGFSAVEIRPVLNSRTEGS